MSHRMDERMNDYFRLMERFLREHPGAVSASEERRAYAHSVHYTGDLARERRAQERGLARLPARVYLPAH